MTQPPKPNVRPTKNRIKPLRVEKNTRGLLREQITNSHRLPCWLLPRAPDRRLGREQLRPRLKDLMLQLNFRRAGIRFRSRFPQSIEPHQPSHTDLVHAQILK